MLVHAQSQLARKLEQLLDLFADFQSQTKLAEMTAKVSCIQQFL